MTSTITRVSIGNPPTCIEHTKTGRWPVKDGLEASPWIFVNLNGRWHAASYEWLAPGQNGKGIHAGNIGEHIGRPPLASWRPRSGELVAPMVSARARFRPDTVQERSDIVMTAGPEGGRVRRSPPGRARPEDGQALSRGGRTS